MTSKDEALKALDTALWRARAAATPTSILHIQVGHAIDALSQLKTALEQPETITVQEAWEACGGNAGIKASKNDLIAALKSLDAVCDEADSAQPEQEPHKGGCTWCGGDCPQFECDTHSTWMNEPVIRRDLPPQPKEPEQEPVACVINGKLLSYKNTPLPDECFLYEGPQPQRKPLMLDRYDAGLLNDFGGGNVDWWWDYLRAELDRAHDFYQTQASHGIKEAS